MILHSPLSLLFNSHTTATHDLCVHVILIQHTWQYLHRQILKKAFRLKLNHLKPTALDRTGGLTYVSFTN